MRKIKMLSIGLLFLVAACTKDYKKINTNPYLATLKQQESDNYLTGKNFPAMINAVLPAGDPPGNTDFVNKYQVAYNLAADAYSGYMGQAGDWGGNSNNLTYAFNVNWINKQFDLNSELIAAWREIKEATAITNDSLQFSVAEIIRVIGTIKTTDNYGPIPSSSLESGSFTPKYDRQDSIYYKAFKDLRKVRDILSKHGANAGAPLKAYDLIYSGNYMKWAKFANSLILRLALRIVYVDATQAKQFAEEALNHEIGMISLKEENAEQSSKPGSEAFNYSNPLRTLTQDYKEARLGASILSYLNGYKDPRLAVWFKPSTMQGNTSVFLGVLTGINVVRSSYQPFSELNVDDKTAMPWMRASEVYFLKAEAAIRGWSVKGTARELYEEGIKSAFSEAGVAIPSTYLEDNSSRQVDYADVVNASNNSKATSTITIRWVENDTFEKKLERIITQKWLALYPNGQEAWTDFRRTGYPRLFPIKLNAGNLNAPKQVRRLPYPLEQYQKNAEQVNRGVTLLGGADNGATRLWWDKKP